MGAYAISAGDLKEKWIDRDAHSGHVINVKQRVRVPVRVALIYHAGRKVNFLWRVVGGEDPIEVFADGHHVLIIAEVWIEILRRAVRRRLRQNDRGPRRAVGSGLELGDPLLRSGGPDELLVKHTHLAGIVNRQGRIQSVVEALQFRRPGAAAIRGAQHMQRIDAVGLVVVVSEINIVAVLRIDGHRYVAAQSLLALLAIKIELGSANDAVSYLIISWVEQVGKWMSSGAAVIIANDNDVGRAFASLAV